MTVSFDPVRQYRHIKLCDGPGYLGRPKMALSKHRSIAFWRVRVDGSVVNTFLTKKNARAWAKRNGLLR